MQVTIDVLKKHPLPEFIAEQVYKSSSKPNSLGNYSQAIPYLDNALAIDPNFKEALDNKGAALSDLANYNEAIPYFNKALAIDPNFDAALYNKGTALYHLGNSTQALSYLVSSSSILNNKGNALYSLGNYAQALQYYEKAFYRSK